MIELLLRHGPRETPRALVPGHAPFCRGSDAQQAVENAVTLEEVARMALFTNMLAGEPPLLEPHVLQKHSHRKHGPDVYRGQPGR